ncbi:D-alanyl-D-alanine carboxypeptidase [Secundilactobacillus oryzae JCM 18671]|uniref:D-alanyl-D-alanine carboxypeptidase n=1 Tax=Secundilactobacillus oryzae JCM 18671 TaxID=1291743 RepID=A0A081BJA9_9LACO|nr:D-alanyl-D-alanine carboxypeptidase [Secundilactobacillus oryzae JCM 18671]
MATWFAVTINSREAIPSAITTSKQPRAYTISDSRVQIYNPQTHQKLRVSNQSKQTWYVLKSAKLTEGNRHETFKYVYLDNAHQGWIAANHLKKVLPLNYKLKKAKAAIAINATTGQVLTQQNANSPQLVASTAKLMTIYLAMQKVQKTKAGWHQKVDVMKDKQLVKMSQDPAHGGFEFKKNRTYTVHDLVDAAMIQSSNNAAIALGEWVAGSNTKFIRLMNQTAKAWGLRQTHFVSSSGLENDDLKSFDLTVPGTSAKAANQLSAANLATIARKLITKYPEILSVSRQRVKKVAGETLYNYTPLLKGAESYDQKLKVDGLKIGYTPRAGTSFVGTGTPNNNRIITVIIKDKKVFDDTTKLMKAASKVNVPTTVINLAKQNQDNEHALSTKLIYQLKTLN